MTLARTALRLATVNALEGATIAGPRVWDSRISDFAPESAVEDALPTIIVLTDKDDGDALSDQDGGPPFKRMVDIVIEMGMVQAIDQNEVDGEAPEYQIFYPDTDAKLEAALDFLEFQVMRRLSSDPADAAELFRSFTRVRKSECHRQTMDDTGIKIAARVLTLTTEVSDDQMEVFIPDDTLPTGVDVLPEPLRSVAKRLPEGSPGAAVCAAMIAALSPLAALRLDGVDFVYTNQNDAPEIVAPVELYPEE